MGSFCSNFCCPSNKCRALLGARLQSGIIPIPDPRFAGDRGSTAASPSPSPNGRGSGVHPRGPPSPICAGGIGDHPHPRFPSGVPCPQAGAAVSNCSDAAPSLYRCKGPSPTPCAPSGRHSHEENTGAATVTGMLQLDLQVECHWQCRCQCASPASCARPGDCRRCQCRRRRGPRPGHRLPGH
jgi:hypothetical protein